MKTVLLKILCALLITSCTTTQTEDANSATNPVAPSASAVTTTPSPQPQNATFIEFHTKMAEMHQKMAACLKGGTAPKECHEQMAKACESNKDSCPSWAGMGGHMMLMGEACPNGPQNCPYAQGMGMMGGKRAMKGNGMMKGQKALKTTP